MIEIQALAHARAEAYDLRVIGLSPVEGGSLNAGYRVEATDGDFHLTCYDCRRYQADRIRRSLDAQEYVGRSELPVPAVRLNLRGDAITDMPRVVEVSRVLSLDFLPDCRLLPEAEDFLVGYHDTGQLTEPEALVLAPPHGKDGAVGRRRALSLGLRLSSGADRPARGNKKRWLIRWDGDRFPSHRAGFLR